MFKKALAAGVLTAGITLTGGIGVASANDGVLKPCPHQEIEQSGSLFMRYVVNPYNNFANVFTQDHNGRTITWYFKGETKACIFHTGRTAYSAYYEGRIK
ncbi:hypothetical protein [Xenorhabdus bovienii]|uniref:hypothetical protein n=1 Tax=Xenorhabdus bovienii TaxID=40576 RepID=UPI0023B27BAD|nr:hypothetical protein [Xenorhabdus bovienii]MDE9481061.1 hypothetical protein [Xenorhabdus bovienii]